MTTVSAPASAAAARRVGELDRDVLHDLVPAGDEERIEPAGELVGDRLCLTVGDEEHPPAAEPLDLGTDLGAPPGAEHDPPRQRFVREPHPGHAATRARSVASSSSEGDR